MYRLWWVPGVIKLFLPFRPRWRHCEDEAALRFKPICPTKKSFQYNFLCAPLSLQIAHAHIKHSKRPKLSQILVRRRHYYLWENDMELPINLHLEKCLYCVLTQTHRHTLTHIPLITCHCSYIFIVSIRALFIYVVSLLILGILFFNHSLPYYIVLSFRFIFSHSGLRQVFTAYTGQRREN